MKKSKYKVSPKHHPALKPVKDKRRLESIDLHGLTVVEALSAVEKRVNDAILADLDRLEIVHGVGTGALLKAVHQYLSGLSVVEKFRLDDLNPGVTYVYF
jgi:DNA mismatch repair protein MutS2